MEFGDKAQFESRSNESRNEVHRIGDVLKASDAVNAAKEGDEFAVDSNINKCESNDENDFKFTKEILLNEKRENGNGNGNGNGNDIFVTNEKNECEISEPSHLNEYEAEKTDNASLDNDYEIKHEPESQDNLALQEDEEVSSVTTTFGTSSLSENPTPLDSEQMGGQSFELTHEQAAQLNFDKIENVPADGQTFGESISPSQLNPDAAEFVPNHGSEPTSPIENQAFSPTANNEMNWPHPTNNTNHIGNSFDLIISQSPRKDHVNNMEDISLPSRRMFEVEIAQRPHELEPIASSQINDVVDNKEPEIGLEPSAYLNSNATIEDILNSVQPLPIDADFIDDDFRTVETEVAQRPEELKPIGSLQLGNTYANEDFEAVPETTAYLNAAAPIEDILNSVQPLPTDTEFNDDLRPVEIEVTQWTHESKPIANFEAGPETSVDLDSDVSLDSPPLPADAKFVFKSRPELCADFVGNKELFNVEEKENASQSPSIEELHSVPSKDAIDLLTSADMQQSVYLEQTSDDAAVQAASITISKENEHFRLADFVKPAEESFLMITSSKQQDIVANLPDSFNDFKEQVKLNKNVEFASLSPNNSEIEKHLIEKTKELPEENEFKQSLYDVSYDVTLPMDELADALNKSAPQTVEGNDSKNCDIATDDDDDDDERVATSSINAYQKIELVQPQEFEEHQKKSYQMPLERAKESKPLLQPDVSTEEENEEIKPTTAAPIETATSSTAADVDVTNDGAALIQIESNAEEPVAAVAAAVPVVVNNENVESKKTENVQAEQQKIEEQQSAITENNLTELISTTTAVVSAAALAGTAAAAAAAAVKASSTTDEKKEAVESNTTRNKIKSVPTATKKSTATSAAKANAANVKPRSANAQRSAATKTSTVAPTAARRPLTASSTIGNARQPTAAVPTKTTAKASAIGARTARTALSSAAKTTATTGQSGAIAAAKPKATAATEAAAAAAAANKPNSLGLNAAAKPKLASPRETLSSQLRKTIGPTNNAATAVGSKTTTKQVIANGGGAATAAAKTTAGVARAKPGGAVGAVAEQPKTTFTARPAPKFISSANVARRTATATAAAAATARKPSPFKLAAAAAAKTASATTNSAGALKTKPKESVKNKQPAESTAAAISKPKANDTETSKAAPLATVNGEKAHPRAADV